MDAVLDHTFLPAKDPQESVRFYTTILGFQRGENFGPFEVVRVNQDLTLDIAQADTTLELHYAFAMDRETFDAVFDRIKAAGLAYGDGPFSSKNMRGPGKTHGAHGMADSVFFHDPSGHMIEIRSY